VGFSCRLATSCNIFYSKDIVKKGPCGERALVAQERPMESGIASFLQIDFENYVFASEQYSLALSSSLIPVNLPNEIPLRC
jgi:hypothetical protein